MSCTDGTKWVWQFKKYWQQKKVGFQPHASNYTLSVRDFVVSMWEWRPSTGCRRLGAAVAYAGMPLWSTTPDELNILASCVFISPRRLNLCPTKIGWRLAVVKEYRSRVPWQRDDGWGGLMVKKIAPRVNLNPPRFCQTQSFCNSFVWCTFALTSLQYEQSFMTSLVSETPH